MRQNQCQTVAWVCLGGEGRAGEKRKDEVEEREGFGSLFCLHNTKSHNLEEIKKCIGGVFWRV